MGQLRGLVYVYTYTIKYILSPCAVSGSVETHAPMIFCTYVFMGIREDVSGKNLRVLQIFPKNE